MELKKFDLSTIPDDKVVVLIGSRGRGKSTLIKDIMAHHKNIPVGTVISPTEQANCFFGNFIPPVFIHDEYKPQIINNFVTRQRTIVKNMRRGTNVDPRGFLILDDCLYDNTWTKDKNIRFIFQNGRHAKILFLFSMQYPLGVPPNLRTNIDYVFIFRENNVQNRKRIYDSYAGIFPTFDIFCEILDQTTENRECMVINNTSMSNKLEDNVFWYKANIQENFRMGHERLWEISAKDDEEPRFDPTEFMTRKKNMAIKVKKVGGEYIQTPSADISYDVYSR